MGNGKSQHNLYCEGCDSKYYSVGSSTWHEAGTVSRWTGYCPSCCGDETRSWTYTGNVVKLRCKNSSCDCTYGVITWDDWRNKSYETIGYCSTCYNNHTTISLSSDISSVLNQLSTLSLAAMPSIPVQYSTLFTSIAYATDNNLTTKFYDYEFKEDHSDEIGFSLERKYTNLYTMDSPNSITLNFTDDHEQKSITITFGVKGSSVHTAVSLNTYKNQKGFRSAYHFGVLLSGNTYTVKDNKKHTQSVKNYMMIHLLEDDIKFMLCKKHKTAMAELNRVWINQHKQISHYHRIIGHSVLSARIICKFLIKEQSQSDIPYNFGKKGGMKERHNNLNIWYPKRDLAQITNCFLFVIRFLKLLNRAHTRKIDVPSAQDIVNWTIGKQKWHNTDIFNHVWEHSKSLAVPFE